MATQFSPSDVDLSPGTQKKLVCRCKLGSRLRRNQGQLYVDIQARLTH
jgi:hypothetical protein